MPGSDSKPTIPECQSTEAVSTPEPSADTNTAASMVPTYYITCSIHYCQMSTCSDNTINLGVRRQMYSSSDYEKPFQLTEGYHAQFKGKHMKDFLNDVQTEVIRLQRSTSVNLENKSVLMSWASATTIRVAREKAEQTLMSEGELFIVARANGGVPPNDETKLAPCGHCWETRDVTGIQG